MPKDAKELIEYLKNFRREIDWVQCPVHNDDRISLSIETTEDGCITLTCAECCSCEDILKALDLTPEDLFPKGYLTLPGRARPCDLCAPCATIFPADRVGVFRRVLAGFSGEVVVRVCHGCDTLIRVKHLGDPLFTLLIISMRQYGGPTLDDLLQHPTWGLFYKERIGFFEVQAELDRWRRALGRGLRYW